MGQVQASAPARGGRPPERWSIANVRTLPAQSKLTSVPGRNQPGHRTY